MNALNGLLLVFLLMAVAFVVASLVAAWLVRDRRSDPAFGSTYECGMEPVRDAWVQFNVRYYVIALIFVVFDVEAVFLFPWAVVFIRRGAGAFIEMAVFLGILILGFVYAWKKGALEWE